MEAIDSKGGGGAHAQAGGHICRELGVTINGNVKVTKVVTMYAHNAPPSSDEPPVSVALVHPPWDSNFVGKLYNHLV